MVWIILCAISYIGIFVVFKIIDVKKAPLINCIVVNYLTAAVLGFCVFGSLPVVSIVKTSWFPMGILLGFLFIVTNRNNNCGQQDVACNTYAVFDNSLQ